MIINFIRHSYTEGNLRKAYIGASDEPLCDEGRQLIKGKRYPECTVLAVSPMKRCVETARLIYGDRSMIMVDGFRECDFGSFEGKNYIELENDADYRSWVEGGCMTACPGGEDTIGFRRRCAEAFEELVGSLAGGAGCGTEGFEGKAYGGTGVNRVATGSHGTGPEAVRSGRYVPEAKADETACTGVDGEMSISLVVHGGTIMAVLEKYAVPHRDFYEWYVENGCGYICRLDDSEAGSDHCPCGSLKVTGKIG